MIPEDIKKLFVEKFVAVGTQQFYDFLINYGLSRIDSFAENELSPEKELMSLYFTFLDYYRIEDNIYYFDIATQCRKAAHKIYRTMLKQQIIEYNPGFLNLVVDNDSN